MIQLVRSALEASIEDDPDGGVRVHYYGRWYSARVQRIPERGGRGAWVWFCLAGWWVRERGDPWRYRWVSPERHGVYLKPRWVRRALDARGIEYESLGRLAEQLRERDRTLRLDASGFEEQALANALDRLAGRYVVDRGSLPIPRVQLW